MDPAREISRLDRSLAKRGSPVTLRRVGSPNVDVDLPAQMTFGRDLTEDGGVSQNEFDVILSPTKIIEAGWPGALAQTDGTDPLVPRRNDRIIANGRSYTVTAPNPAYLNGVLVRIDLKVRG